MELAAAVELGPDPGQKILSIGFGPGVGIAELARRFPEVEVVGIDPSEAMVRIASRRTSRAIERGQVVLRCAGAESIPWPDCTFDAVAAVNSIQLWQLDAAIAEVARVIWPGGTLVAVTHCWAIERRSSVEDWVASVTCHLAGQHMAVAPVGTRVFRSGRALVLRATTVR